MTLLQPRHKQTKRYKKKNVKLDPERRGEEEVDGEEAEGKNKDEKAEVAFATVREAVEAIRAVSRFYEVRSENNTIVSQIMDIEEHLESRYWASRRRHMKFTDYLSLPKAVSAYRMLLHVLHYV